MDRAILPEPTAFALATVSPDGQPSVRMLLLKGVDARGFVFYTNLMSRKAAELSANPRAAMCFHWAPLELQVRVEGVVSPVSEADADEYFASRPRESQLGAWASRQSQKIPDGETLKEHFDAVAARYSSKTVPRPSHWSGFLLTPSVIEMWQGKPFRLHLRERFSRVGDGWSCETLFP